MIDYSGRYCSSAEKLRQISMNRQGASLREQLAVACNQCKKIQTAQVRNTEPIPQVVPNFRMRKDVAPYACQGALAA